MDSLLQAGANLIHGAGPFFWCLLPLSLIAAYIVCERFYALRRESVMPPSLVEQVLAGKVAEGSGTSVLGRILRFAADPVHDADAVKAYARLEINRMERGFVVLEIVVGVAPMFGLMGTVVALIGAFGAINPETGVAAQAALTSKISLALSTTVLGLMVAIPALFFSSLLARRVETYAVQMDALLERAAARRSSLVGVP